MKTYLSFRFSKNQILTLIILLVLYIFLNDAFAYKEGSTQVLGDITVQYKNVLNKSADFFKKAALSLFMLLALINIVWKIIPTVLEGNANITTVFVELIKTTLTYGFFLALLTDGSPIEITRIGEILITESPDALIQSGYDVMGKVSFSFFPDLGFAIIQRVLLSSSWTSPIASTMCIIVALCILALLTIIGLKYLLLTIEAWLTLYSGILMIGFSGLDATRDITINFIKSIVALMFQIFTFVLLAVIGKDIMLSTLNTNPDINWNIVGGLLMESIVLYGLLDSLPSKMAGFISNASITPSAGAAGSAARSVGAGTAGAIGGATGAIGGYMAGKSAGEAAGLGNTGNLKDSMLTTQSDSKNKGNLGYTIGAKLGKAIGNKARKTNNLKNEEV